MTNLIGLAFTSPQIAVMVCDREKFRVHYYQNRPHELHAFLQEDDPRKPVIILKSVQDLRRIQNVDGIHALMLFDDPEVMSKISGLRLLDAESDSDFSGFKKRLLPREELNEALSSKGNFSLEEDPQTAVGTLSEGISFRELALGLTTKVDLPDDFLENVCLYLVGALQKKSWVSRVQKKGLSAGVSVEKMAEMEKFIEQSPEGEALWRALYEVMQSGVSVPDASDQLDASEEDVDFVLQLLGEAKDLHYYRNPRDKPLVLKKKRMSRKTKSHQATRDERRKGGRSIIPHRKSTVDEKKLAEAQKENEMSEHESFDLVGLLQKIDEATSAGKEPYAFSRMACARLCGLVKASPYNAACKQAIVDGADKKDVTAIRNFIKDDPAAEKLWVAYCDTAYHVNVDEEKAASSHGVSVTQLKAILAYKPMAFVYDFANWPKQLE